MLNWKVENSNAIVGYIDDEDLEIKKDDKNMETDLELNQQLAFEIMKLDSDREPLENLIEIDRLLTFVHYNIDELIFQSNILDFLFVILHDSVSTSESEVVFRILSRIIALSDVSIFRIANFVDLLIKFISSPVLLLHVLSILYTIIKYDEQFCDQLILSNNILSLCSKMMLIMPSLETRVPLLTFILIILKKSKIVTLHTEVEGKEAIRIPLQVIKHFIMNNMSVLLSLRIFNFILGKWTGNFVQLFDTQFVKCLLTIWNRRFQEKWEFKLCGEICQIWNGIIIHFPEDFVNNRLYQYIIEVAKDLTENPFLQHSKILFMLSNVAYHSESANMLMTSGIMEKYAEHYEEMTFAMKENFLFTFVNSCLCHALLINDDPRTKFFLEELFSFVQSDCSKELVWVMLELLDNNTYEISLLIEKDDVVDMLAAICEIDDEEISTRASNLLTAITSED